MDRSDEPTVTGERVAENATPAKREPVTRRQGDTDPNTGLPPGMHDDDSSPLDPGGTLDPARLDPRNLDPRNLDPRKKKHEG